MIKRILVPFSGDASEAHGLALALILAKRFGAHVRVLHSRYAGGDQEMIQKNPFWGGPSDPVKKYLIERLAERETAARAGFDAMIATHDVPCGEPDSHQAAASVSWSALDGTEADAIKEHGNVNDLIVLGHRARNDSDDRALEQLASCLFAVGRPTLLAPETLPNGVGDRIVIGWNNSPQCTRAMSAALPFLKAAQSVRVSSHVASARPGASARDVAAYLHAHDVDAETREHAGDRRSIGRMLLDEVADFAADLLVVGAYSHSQFRETLFGGATHYLLQHAHCPVLLSH